MRVYIRPPLKWAGGKFRLLDRIRSHLPAGKRLVEPFVGSGAVFLNTDYDEYLLCDNNADLIHFYRCLLGEKRRFIDIAGAFFNPANNTAEVYAAFRERFNQLSYGIERAALFLYLNRHGYNGLIRYNAKGAFNVPFGRYARPGFPGKSLEAFLKKADTCGILLEICDFREAFAKLREGDVVYCDPPYIPLSATARFTEYTGDGFGPQEQRMLAARAIMAARRGHSVLVSNHDTEFTRQIYRRANVGSFRVQRSISCKTRRDAPELLAVFEPSSRHATGKDTAR